MGPIIEHSGLWGDMDLEVDLHRKSQHSYNTSFYNYNRTPALNNKYLAGNSNGPKEIEFSNFG